jgi:hypothetical protein
LLIFNFLSAIFSLRRGQPLVDLAPELVAAVVRVREGAGRRDEPGAEVAGLLVLSARVRAGATNRGPKSQACSY